VRKKQIDGNTFFTGRKKLTSRSDDETQLSNKIWTWKRQILTKTEIEQKIEAKKNIRIYRMKEDRKKIERRQQN
jgi:hypothetical protein